MGILHREKKKKDALKCVMIGKTDEEREDKQMMLDTKIEHK